MERRVTSHTEEEEMNQRRRLLTLARKGDQKAVEQLFELYQVKVFSGDSLKRKKLPTFPLQKPVNVVPKGSYAPEKKEEKVSAKILAGAKKPRSASLGAHQKTKALSLGTKSAPTKGIVVKPGKGQAVRKPGGRKAGKAQGPSRPVRKTKAPKTVKVKAQRASSSTKAKSSKKPAKKK